MNEAFAAFLHALPTLLGAAVVFGCLVGFWRGLSLQAKDPGQQSPNPKSIADYCFDTPRDPPPRWLRRWFRQ